jgi:hypothetical protein
MTSLETPCGPGPQSHCLCWVAYLRVREAPVSARECADHVAREPLPDQQATQLEHPATTPSLIQHVNLRKREQYEF